MAGGLIGGCTAQSHRGLWAALLAVAFGVKGAVVGVVNGLFERDDYLVYYSDAGSSPSPVRRLRPTASRLCQVWRWV
jgi:hypothetical protein